MTLPTPLPLQLVSNEIPDLADPFDEGPPQVDDLRLGTWDKPNIIAEGDARNLPLPTGSAALALTAPPTFEDFQELHKDSSWSDYVDFLSHVISELWRVLEAGGRVAMIVDPRPGVGHIPSEALIHTQFQKAGFILRGSIVWAKSLTPHPLSSAVLRGPHDPPIVGVTERIIFASKLTPFRRNTVSERREIGMPFRNDISVTKWASNRIDLWTIPAPEPGPFIHDNPFPVELATRLIETHTYENEIVVDPMCGTGTTAIAAQRLNRRFYACDIDHESIDTARKRISIHTTQDVDESAKQQPTQPAQKESYERLDLTKDNTA